MELDEESKENILYWVGKGADKALEKNDYFGFIPDGTTPKKHDESPSINESKALTTWFLKQIVPKPDHLSDDKFNEKLKQSIVDAKNDKQIDAIYFVSEQNPAKIYIIQTKFYSDDNTVEKDVINDIESVCEKLFNNTDRFNRVNSKTKDKLETIFALKQIPETKVQIDFYLVTTDFLSPSAEKEWASLKEYVKSSSSDSFNINVIKADAKYLSDNYFYKDAFQEAMINLYK